MEAATTTLERRVREIPPTRKPEELLRNYDGKMRVAAYCRVSTDSEEQLNSYEAQKTYYTQKIQDNPDWEMAGIYADEGISGTSLKKRAEFNKMITACKRGRIDFIITKSLSRFARNTVDCLDTVRLLKANGIGVYFEKENINTLTESSEFLVTLFSGFAQAESESLSKNVAWGKEKSAKAGNVHFQYKKMLGYRKGEDGQPKIVPEEATTGRTASTFSWGMQHPPGSLICCLPPIQAPWTRSNGSWTRTVFPQPRVWSAGHPPSSITF